MGCELMGECLDKKECVLCNLSDEVPKQISVNEIMLANLVECGCFTGVAHLLKVWDAKSKAPSLNRGLIQNLIQINSNLCTQGARLWPKFAGSFNSLVSEGIGLIGMARI